MLDWNEDWKPTLPYSVTNYVHANPKSQEKSDPCGAGPEKDGKGQLGLSIFEDGS